MVPTLIIGITFQHEKLETVDDVIELVFKDMFKNDIHFNVLPLALDNQ